MIENNKVKALTEQAKELRKTALKMIHAAQSGHPGGSLSAADIITVLYFDELNIDPKNPKWQDRDRFVLSKGHVAPILYSALIMKGFLREDEIYTLRQFGSRLQGHPDMKKTPGVDISTGSLGQGISTAVGMALGLKRDQSPARVFTLVGDGESNEGQVWEAAMAAAKYELDNLVVFLDKNGLQNDGTTQEIMPSGNMFDKFKSFGFETFEIDGHKIEEILDVLEKIKNSSSKQPKAVVANTVKGKGVSFMEHVVMWHGVAPSDAELAQALEEVDGGLS